MQIGKKIIGINKPTYFVADIAANHDGDLSKAKELIHLAAEAGADAAKFQHFSAETIVSDKGFKDLGSQKSHQSKWTKSVFETYKDASIDLSWTVELKNTCDKAGIAFFSSPYSIELVDHLDNYVPAYKIGSGDITWLEIIKHVAKKGKPYMIATGASSITDVERVINEVKNINNKIVIMQCNTNYTASHENFKYININVLKLYKKNFPELILGLSDHTPGHTTVLGAVTLGARVIEKHFTDDNERDGPDHKFSMNPTTWKLMVESTRELEISLGNEIKKVEENEDDTVVLQRRSIRAKKRLIKGHVIKKEDLICLRPCPKDALTPIFINNLVGKKVITDKEEGDYFKQEDLS
tara:strand:+ start:6289 stop:7347 length:1059 start_codon:yes stop_codon:yes gene_type:complete